MSENSATASVLHKKSGPLEVCIPEVSDAMSYHFARATYAVGLSYDCQRPDNEEEIIETSYYFKFGNSTDIVPCPLEKSWRIMV